MRRGIFFYVSEEFKEQLFEEVKKPDGKAFVEKEYVLYAKIKDESLLDTAQSFEIQEQWEVKIPKTNDNACSGRIRIRKTTDKDSNVTYVQTTKTKEEIGELEVELITTEDAYTQFKKVATSGMYKYRYIFPIKDSDLKWEVDVFVLPDGNKSRWVKIDLEVRSNLENGLPELPNGFSNVIYNQKSKQTDQERKIIKELYDTVFLRKNEFSSNSTSRNSFADLIKN